MSHFKAFALPVQRCAGRELPARNCLIATREGVRGRLAARFAGDPAVRLSEDAGGGGSPASRSSRPGRGEASRYGGATVVARARARRKTTPSLIPAVLIRDVVGRSTDDHGRRRIAASRGADDFREASAGSRGWRDVVEGLPRARKIRRVIRLERPPGRR